MGLGGYGFADRAGLEGTAGEREFIRSITVTVTGLTNADQLTAEVVDHWNGEALAVETVDQTTPTGGTRFDISASGEVLTIKGLSQEVVGTIAEHVHKIDTGTGYSVHSDVVAGDITVEFFNFTNGTDIDLTGLSNGKIAEAGITYVTAA